MLLLAGAGLEVAPAFAQDKPTAPDAAAHGATGGLMPAPVLPKELRPADEKEPWYLRLVFSERPKGMLVRLPIMDTDPNRGLTIGALPVWITNGSKEDRIVMMHGPSISYNQTFKANFTDRFFYYPTEDSTLMTRLAISQVAERELFIQYDDANLFNAFGEWGVKGQYLVDGSNRFFGVGPNTPYERQVNFVSNTIQYAAYFGMPVREGSHWYWTAEHRLAGNKIADGPIKTIPGVTTLFANAVPAHYHQTSSFLGYLTFDTLDNSITTTRGTYAEFLAETSQRAWASEYSYQRYGADLRHFFWTGQDDHRVTAARLKFEQIVGNEVSLWQLPWLGGKYVHPAYGDGRYTDRGLMTATVEERFIVYEMKTSGLSTKFEVSPFLGLGTAFDNPSRMAKRYARPLYGVGLRAVAPPQVVGSIDIGLGQEGMSVFSDINYPF